MFGTADPGPQIAFLGSFGSLRPFGAELAITAFGLACQQMKQAGTLTNEQSSESAHGARDSTYQQNTTNIGRKPVEITARRSGSALSQVHQNNQQQHQQAHTAPLSEALFRAPSVLAITAGHRGLEAQRTEASDQVLIGPMAGIQATSRISSRLPPISGIRNILIHAYDRIAAEILVDIVRQDIPPLLDSVKRILGEDKD